MSTALLCSTFRRIGKISNARQILNSPQYLQHFLFIGRQNLSAVSRHLGGLIHHRKRKIPLRRKLPGRNLKVVFYIRRMTIYVVCIRFSEAKYTKQNKVVVGQKWTQLCQRSLSSKFYVNFPNFSTFNSYEHFRSE